MYIDGLMPPDQLKKYGFCNDGDKPKMEGYNYLLKSKLYTWETIDDNEFYTDTCKSFNSLGFNAEEQEAVWKTLSCTLNLGNVDIDSSVTPCSLKEGQFLDKVVSLLAVDKAALIEGCCVKKITIQGQTISSARSPIQCESIRDALAKDLFNNVFNWIVRKLNLTLLPDKPEQYIAIGLLDIFGFEDFLVNSIRVYIFMMTDVNSIEQFCINYTNEKLQNLYISYVFKAEKVIFEEEGLGKPQTPPLFPN